MTNGDLFYQMFRRRATEVWALPEDEFLQWLNTADEMHPCERCQGYDYYGCPYSDDRK